MGMTGAGKSTFIEHCTKPTERLSGHELSSCTSQVSIHTTCVLGRTVHLIDTPGFNDSRRSDGETLQELAYWLAAAYERDIKLSGIIYLHCITNNRFQGSAVRALRAFKKMCGEEVFKGIIVATTMWDKVTTDELAKAEVRHEDLQAKIRQDVIRGGGKLVRLSAVEIDAARILQHIVSKDRRLTLAFQRELVDENRLIHETGAGQVLYDDLKGSIETLQAKTQEAQEKIEKMAHSSRREELRELEDAVTEMTKTMRSVDEDIDHTKVTLDDIRKAWDANIDRDDETISAAARRIEQQLEIERCRQGTKSTTQSASDNTVYGGSSAVSSSVASGSQSSQADMSRRLKELEKERKELTYQMGRRLNRRYTKRSRSATTIGVIGTGLAVGQLVAAIACVVM
ncbi:hypothetical protein CC77DRAFT_1066727 [Alternaria alternata]|uniref:AIG1-type G domain-containing protein n=1 Tax=Alternaria alternata TaxID=5599 RepID=A0A177D593_ALTAL|nr:hypothetical protein CC77DRAFT_1066727 [Alternaria alternata]OAG14668.1 hypothetical protein CC77DRAFT_1066727 [Alternaria alternata]